MKKKTRITLLVTTLVLLFAMAMPASAASTKGNALKAYKKYLAQNSYLKKFAVVYLNNDSTPELVTYMSGGKPSIFTFKKNKVAQVNKNFSNTYYEHYYKKKGVLVGKAVYSEWKYQGYLTVNVKKSTLAVIAEKEDGKYYKITNPDTLDRKQITKKQFQSLLKKYVGEKKATKIKYYKNTAKNRNKILK